MAGLKEQMSVDLRAVSLAGYLAASTADSMADSMAALSADYLVGQMAE